MKTTDNTVLIERLQGIAQDPAADAKNKDRAERSRRGDADMVILKSGLQEPFMKAQCVLRRRRWAGSFRACLITFCKADERAPKLEELADKLEIDVEKVREAMQHTQCSLSVDAPFSTGDARRLLDVLPDKEFTRMISETF